MISFLLNLDQDIFLFFNRFNSLFWDEAMFMFSGKFIWAPMYAAFLFALYKGFGAKTATVWTLAIIATIVVADQGCSTFIRPYFERLRPSNPNNPLSELVHIVNNYRGGSYGFPSCHAANSFGFATIMACIWRGTRLKWFIFLWAFVNSYSRLYLGVHYPGDLLVGGIIGSAAGLLLYFAARAVLMKMHEGEVWSIRAKSKTITINNKAITYNTVDYAIITGIVTIAVILLVAAG